MYLRDSRSIGGGIVALAAPIVLNIGVTSVGGGTGGNGGDLTFDSDRIGGGGGGACGGNGGRGGFVNPGTNPGNALARREGNLGLLVVTESSPEALF